jgi:hypothetical protein
MTVDDPGLAYAYNEVRLRVTPTPQDITRAEIVDSWLVWLYAVEGKRSVHRIFHWSYGAPLWQLAQREHRSERTISIGSTPNADQPGTNFVDFGRCRL